MGKKYSIFTMDETTVMVLQNFGKEKIFQLVTQAVRYVKTLGSGYTLYTGVSDSTAGLAGLARLYRKAESALRLALHRGGLTVFIHPNTGNALRDHRDHAIWMGAIRPLDLSGFKGFSDHDNLPQHP